MIVYIFILSLVYYLKYIKLGLFKRIALFRHIQVYHKFIISSISLLLLTISKLFRIRSD